MGHKGEDCITPLVVPLFRKGNSAVLIWHQMLIFGMVSFLEVILRKSRGDDAGTT